MRIEIEDSPIQGQIETHGLRQKLTERIRKMLGVFATSIAKVSLKFGKNRNANPKLQSESVLVRVDFYTGGRLLLESTGPTYALATISALGRLRTAVEKEMHRRWEWVDLQPTPKRSLQTAKAYT